MAALGVKKCLGQPVVFLTQSGVRLGLDLSFQYGGRIVAEVDVHDPLRVAQSLRWLGQHLAGQRPGLIHQPVVGYHPDGQSDVEAQLCRIRSPVKISSLDLIGLV